MDILFTTLPPVEMALMALGIWCAAIMRAFTGFGFALTAVPVLSLFLGANRCGGSCGAS